MNADDLRFAAENVGVAAAGLAFSFNPIALTSIPVSLAYVTRGRDKGQAPFLGALFIFGMILTHVVLGFVAGLGGKWAAEVRGRAWGLFLGPLLIVLSLV